MNKIFLTEKDLEFLSEWESKNVDLVTTFPIPIKAIKITTELAPIVFTVLRDRNKATLSMSRQGLFVVKCFYEIKGKEVFLIREKYNKKVNKSILNALKKEDKFEIIKLYFCLMAIMAYGEYLQEWENIPAEQIVRLAEEKQKTKETKNKLKKKNKRFCLYP